MNLTDVDDRTIKAAAAAVRKRLKEGRGHDEYWIKDWYEFRKIERLEASKAIVLVTKIETMFPEAKKFIDSQYPADVRASDQTGNKAKVLIKRLVPLTVRSPNDADKWQTAIDSI